MNARFARWRLGLEIAAWRHGLLWPLTGFCALLAAAVWVLMVSPQRQSLDEMTARLNALPQSGRMAATSAREADPQFLAWQRIRQTWPEAAAMDAQIAGVLQLAQKQGVSIEEAEYQYRLEPELDALKVTMTMPMRGAYSGVRRLMDAVLLAHPNLALEELAIKRDNVASAEAEVKARWVAWYPVSVQKASSSAATLTTGAKPAPAPGIGVEVVR